MQILIVEDDPALQKVVALTFSKAGHEAALASNGLEAVELCAREGERFAAILLDIQMPVMDGIEAVKQLRAHPKTHSTVLVCLSAHVETTGLPADVRPLFDGVVSKPFSPRDLRDAVLALVASHAAPERAGS